MLNEESRLIESFKAFCAENGLPYQDAEELLLLSTLTQSQRTWLEGFCIDWEEMIELERARS